MSELNYGYNLQLDHEEMKFIRDVLRLVGGDPLRSRRRIADRILETIYQDKALAWDEQVKDIKKDPERNMYSCVWFTTESGEV